MSVNHKARSRSTHTGPSPRSALRSHTRRGSLVMLGSPSISMAWHHWRRRRDSNPRYGNSPYGGLANRWFQPLTHVSGKATARRYIGRHSRLQPERSSGDDIDADIKVHRLARFEHAEAELGPLRLRLVQRGIGVGHRF